MQTFANLPKPINEAITTILKEQQTTAWIRQAERLHERYMTNSPEIYIQTFTDVLAYLALRVPATYAQIYGALSQIQEIIPSYYPVSILDIGSGPGTGIWAAKEIWPNLKNAAAIDSEKYFINIGKEITQKSDFPLSISWQLHDLSQGIQSKGTIFDIVIMGNVLNELSPREQKIVVQEAFSLCNGILIIIEPSTQIGGEIIEQVAKTFSNKAILLAPYVQNSFVPDQKGWLHFSQRFIRPEFERRVRQHMRQSPQMASDWEEAQFAYVAISKIPPQVDITGRVIGPVKKQKGFIEVPLLTKDKIEDKKIFKRDKQQFTEAKRLRWGEGL